MKRIKPIGIRYAVSFLKSRIKMRFTLTEKNAVNAYGLIPNREKYYALKGVEEKAIKYEKY